MRIRIGKDIKIKWAVLTDGSALPLNKEELTLELAGPNGKSQSMEFEVEGNVLTTTFYGKDQNYTGDYMLTLWKNKGKEGQSVVDKTSAFSLVRYTPQEGLAQKHDNLSATLADLGDTSLVTIDGASETTLVCNLTGYKAVEDVSDLPMEPSTIGYLVGDNLYVYVGEGGDTLDGKYKNCGPFRGLKGDRGPQGNSGYQGAAGELEVVNDLTSGGEAKALSAEMGKVLDGKKQDNLQTYHESGDYTETSIGVHNVILAQASCSGNTCSSLVLVDKDETREPEERVARLAVEKDGNGNYIQAGKDAVSLKAVSSGAADSNIEITPKSIQLKGAQAVEVTSPGGIIIATGEVDGENTEVKSNIHVTNEAISMSSPSGGIADVVGVINDLGTSKADKTEVEDLRKALGEETLRATGKESDLSIDIQRLQDETEDLQSMRDTIDSLGADKADKSALEAINKEVEKKQDILEGYREHPSKGTVEIFGQEKVSMSVDYHENIAEVGTYYEDSDNGAVPIARIESTYESGDYAFVEARGNEVNIVGDYVNVNGDDLSQTIQDVVALNLRVYELGDFPTSGAAEAKAKEDAICKNPDISIIHYTVNNATSHIILQDVNDGLTQQVLYYAGNTFIRHLGANLNASWRKTNPTNIKYNQVSHRIALMHMVNQYGEGDNNIDWVELPTASTSTDGLMTMAQVKSLEGKQDQLANYVEIPRGKTTIKYPNGTARVEVSNARAGLWANDDKVAIAADANGTRMLYTKTAEDGSIEHGDEISIGRHNDSSATHITLTSKSTTEDTGEKMTNTSTIQVNPDGISMSSPEGAIGDVVKEIAAHQNDGIKLLDNGNLKLTLKGVTREFMPATPSGDPMHYAYVSAGAEYNATGVDIVKTGIFDKSVIHKNGYWYLNEIGDLTNEDMRIIFKYAEFLEFYTIGDRLSTIKIRTLVSSDKPYDITSSSFRAMRYIETIKIPSMYSYVRPVNNKIGYAFYNNMTNLRKIINVIYCYNKTVFENTCFVLPKLEDIAIKALPSSISFELCPNLSKESVKYMIDNATPTSAITITLHPDAYARLANQPDILAALEAKPLVTLVSA